MQYTNGNPAKIERNLTIAEQRIAGATYKELSQKHNLSTAQISYILNDSEIKDIVESGTKALISMVPFAIDNYQTFLTTKDHPDHYKASKDALQATGILPSHTLNQTIVNIFNQTNNIVADPQVLKSIQRYAGEDIIDVDLGINPDESISSGSED